MKTISTKNRKIILDSIRDIHDFPKPGIIFKDISTLLSNPEALNTLMSHLQERYENYSLDYIAGIDARGFIFGSILADRLGLGFVTVRKKGKLPYITIAEKYELEYGSSEIEVHIDAFGENGCCHNTGKPSKVLLIDDLIATGGTASAAANLIEKVGARCVEVCFIMELDFLQGRKNVSAPVYSVLHIE